MQASKRASAFPDGAQSAEQMGELRDMETIDGANLGNITGVVHVVGESVMSLSDVEDRIGTIAEFVGEQEGGDARRVVLPGEHQQVALQAKQGWIIERRVGRALGNRPGCLTRG